MSNPVVTKPSRYRRLDTSDRIENKIKHLRTPRSAYTLHDEVTLRQRRQRLTIKFRPTFFACPAPKLIVVVVPPEGIHLCGAFSFQPLYGHFEVNGCVFEPAAYSPSNLVPICTPQLTHLPVVARQFPMAN